MKRESIKEKVPESGERREKRDERREKIDESSVNRVLKREER